MSNDPKAVKFVDTFLGRFESKDKTEGEGDELDEMLQYVKENLASLAYEPYIDDQYEISEIWDTLDRMLEYLEENEASPEQKECMKEIYVEDYNLLCQCGCEDKAEACLASM